MSNKHRLLLTGATGFVGSAIQKRIVADGSYDLTIAVRNVNEQSDAVRIVKVDDLTTSTDWSEALKVSM